MKNLALRHIQKMQPYKPPLTNRRGYNGLLLDFNESTLPPDAKVAEAAKNILDQNMQIYPEYGGLEEMIAEYVGVDPSQIMLTNGSDQAVEVIFKTFSEKDDKLIIPTPSFDMFFQYSGVIGSRIISPGYSGDRLDYPIAEVLENIDEKTKVVVVCNPNNPTGGIVSLSDIKRIAQKAENSIVFVDEAYFEFSKVNAIPLISNYPNVIVTRTFSKAFGLAALRAGYIIADELYISEMLKVRGPYSVNMAAYAAAKAALENKKYALDYADEVMTFAKPLVENFFVKNKIKFYPSSANFILFKPPNPSDVFKKLSEAGILLRPQNKPGIKDTLRLSIGTLKQMEQFCETYGRVILS